MAGCTDLAGDEHFERYVQDLCNFECDRYTAAGQCQYHGVCELGVAETFTELVTGVSTVTEPEPDHRAVDCSGSDVEHWISSVDPIGGPVGVLGLSCAMSATVEAAGNLGSVADHFAGAMLTDRREQMNSAFEAVEHVSVSGRDNFKCFVVVVAAYFTDSHDDLSFGIGWHCCRGAWAVGAPVRTRLFLRCSVVLR